MPTPNPRQVPTCPGVCTHVPQLELPDGPLLRAALHQQVDPHLPVGHWGRF